VRASNAQRLYVGMTTESFMNDSRCQPALWVGYAFAHSECPRLRRRGVLAPLEKVTPSWNTMGDVKSHQNIVIDHGKANETTHELGQEASALQQGIE
jgi:hypothetical protein